MKERILFSFYFLAISVSLGAQQIFNIEEQIDWSAELEDYGLVEGQMLSIPFCKGCFPSISSAKHPFLPLHSTSVKIAQRGQTEFFPFDLKTAPFEQELTDQVLKNIPEEFVFETSQSTGIQTHSANLTVLPLRKNAFGQVEKLISYRGELKTKSKASDFNAPFKRDYASNSVLASGDFYKISVEENGIHKIDAALLEELGLPTSGWDLNQFKLYGNAGGMLPERAGTDRADDLQECRLTVEDQNGNGKMDEGDYFLFYGMGPDQWQYFPVESEYRLVKHPYSFKHHYFITLDGESGKRVQSFEESETANNSSDSFDQLTFINDEVNSLMGTGRNWFGDIFSSGSDRNYNFLLTDLVTENPVSIRTRIASRTIDGVTGRMKVSAQGTQLHEHVISASGSGIGEAFAGASILKKTTTLNSENLSINLLYSTSGSGNAWLDFIEISNRRSLNLSSSALESGQLLIRDRTSIGSNVVTDFEFSNASNALRVWDVSDPSNALELNVDGSKFTRNTESLRTFIAFDGSEFRIPMAVGPIENQNLHAIGAPDMIVVTHPNFMEPSNAIADFHRAEGMNVEIVKIQEIYNEFSSGTQDLSAIRDFFKMLYDRSVAGESTMTKYALFMGDASYDFRGIKFTDDNTNFVPSYQSINSIHRRDSYCTDDYFALLNDDEGDNMAAANLELDIAVGRFPVKTAEEGMNMVNKILHYKSAVSKGPWLNNITFVSDDEDGNLHFEDSEVHSETVEEFPNYNIDKIYLDAFPQVSGSSGESYPAAAKAINDNIFSGTFIMNYAGHGSENLWTQEKVLQVSDIRAWENMDKLPLFITATCSFSHYDDPNKTSAGEEVILNPKGGAIAIVTTVRVVYAQQNRKLNTAFLNNAFRKIDGEYPTLGTIMLLGKNDAKDVSLNNRKFVLLGDPALKLNYPENSIRTLSIENESVESAEDTLKALSRVKIRGEVVDVQGQRLENFNGDVYPVIYDKIRTIKTLGNDLSTGYDPEMPEANCTGGGSCPAEFNLQNSIVFRGKATVENGAFSFTFVVPKDISYNFGNGKISYYAADQAIDAAGNDQSVVVGGVSSVIEEDNVGPIVDVYMNDESFVYGGITDNAPTLFVKLRDDSGINTTGSGIGHDLTADLAAVDAVDNLDAIANQTLVLNNAYESLQDSYQEGIVRYPLRDLSPGLHEISVKAWDVYNNSGEGFTQFVVAESANLALGQILNYPNPFIDNTTFWVEHNRAGDQLNLSIQIFSVSGRLIKTIQQDIMATGNRIDDVFWDGRDDFGNNIGKGVYVYVVSLTGSDGSTVRKTEKLVVLK